MKKYILFILLIFTSYVYANETDLCKCHIQGSVYGLEFNNSQIDTVPLIAANIYWQDTTIGTTSNNVGFFRLAKPTEKKGSLIFSYVGYTNDTLNIIPDDTELIVYLKNLRSMEKIYVTAKKPTTVHKLDGSVSCEVITSNGLVQLACCSLAESFENTASVEVEQNDAVSGTRRIKMLGLAGFYTQMMIEKKPVMRGLISPFSLEYIPGFWMESVNISKGTASVATGYESITGQINVELKKPENSKPIAVNGYINSMGKSDIAIIGAKQFNPKISTMLLTYTTFLQNKTDINDDTFLDMPLMQQFNIMNRWKFNGDKFKGQIGFKMIHDDRYGGQENFNFDNPNKTPHLYGSENKIRRYEIYSKTGYIVDDQGSSIGLILSAFQHNMDSYWGLKNYSGEEKSLYANLSYNKNLPSHKISTGLSYQYDDRIETYLDNDYDNSEKVPGIFGEYTFQPNDKITAMAGIRYDNHSKFGNFITPRAHLNYRPIPETSLRLSAGTGYRNPHIFMDNTVILASSKNLVIMEDIKAEEAWNIGTQLTQQFSILNNRPATLVVDFYHTEFQNQIIIDMEQNFQNIYLYNLDGESYSNAFQVELSSKVTKDFEITAAIRYNDVKSTYAGKLKSIPMNYKYKGLLVLSYNTPNEKWQMNLTTQFNGKVRLPNTENNPVEYQLNKYSKNYVMMFAQLKRKFDKFEIYAGIENITGYRQKNPILAWDDPFSPYFDSTMIWGPTLGRRFYIGFRFN